jgi:hypothetical protein
MTASATKFLLLENEGFRHVLNHVLLFMRYNTGLSRKPIHVPLTGSLDIFDN